MFRQYSFKEDGSYMFISKLFDPLMDEMFLGRESGTYQVTSNAVKINPAKSVLEAWSKKDNADQWGNLLSSQNIDLEKTNYQFTKRFIEENNEWQLVLQAAKQTLRDGPFSSSSTGNAWIYIVPSSARPEIKLPYEHQIKIEEIKKEPLPQTAINKLQTEQQNSVNTTLPAKQDGFAFTTPNFDDGWTSTVQEDWVEVIKGNTKVLLHYPKEGTIFSADPEPLTQAAWNILVAPRYSNLNNFGTSTITSYQRPYFGFGYATVNSTGKEMYIVIFHQGQTGWLEVITKDKNSFIQQYKFDPESTRWDSETDLLNPLIAMFSYNKFAVAASDFTGKWTSDFSGIQQLYNVYTGNYAGMNVSQSNEEFDFKDGNNYNWKFLAVNGMVGTMKYNKVNSSGKLTIPNNWQVKFSKIENKAKTYHVFWSCIKGARILNLLDADFPGSGIYTQYGKAK